MEKNYIEVPVDILTGKDLDYLSDMFEWNYGALKSTNSALGSVSDTEIVQMLNKAALLFDNNLNGVLNILNEIGGNSNEQ